MSTVQKWLTRLQAQFNPFNRHYAAGERRMFAFLRQNVLFRNLKDEELVEFLPHIYERIYGKNEVIFFRNDPSQAFYLIKTGRVMLTLDTNDRFEKLVVLARYNYFGENALLTRKNRMYNAISLSDKTQVYAIPQVHLAELFEDEPEIRYKIVEALAEVYEQNLSNIFRAYSTSFGFFDLGQVCFSGFGSNEEDEEYPREIK